MEMSSAGYIVTAEMSYASILEKEAFPQKQLVLVKVIKDH